MKRFLIFLSIFALASAGLSSQELPGEGDRISAVSVTGLKRTKPPVIEKPLQKFIGRDAGSLDINEVYAVVQGSGVLEALSVEIRDNQEGDGKTLAVTVREKWSIIPIPFGGISSNGWSVGGVFMDTNAFGIKDTMMVMGLFGPGDLTASLMYLHSPAGVGGFGWNLMGFFSRQENELTDQTGKQTLRRYNSMSVRPSIGLSYLLSESVNAGIGLSYLNVMLRDTEDPVNAPENGTQGITLSPSIGVRRNTWDGYFLNENQGALKYDYTLVIDGDDVHSVSLNAAFNHSFFPGFRITAKSGAVFSTAFASPFFESPPMSAAVNILPTSYQAASIAGVSLGLEKSLFKFKFGVISLLAAYQAVYSHSALLPHQFDHGPVAMLQMYFSRVAIPGMGLGGAYNVDKNTWQYAFNMGMTF
jgi:hypothetical protein